MLGIRMRSQQRGNPQYMEAPALSDPMGRRDGYHCQRSVMRLLWGDSVAMNAQRGTRIYEGNTLQKICKNSPTEIAELSLKLMFELSLGNTNTKVHIQQVSTTMDLA